MDDAALRPEPMIRDAVAGDEVAFAQIVATYDDDLARVAYLVCGDLDLAHEATQAAWLRAWRKLSSLRDPDRLRPWLVAIAVNEARQVLRRRRRRAVREITMDDLETVAGTRSTDMVDERLLDLRRVLAGLSPEDRGLVAMRYVLGLTSDEIGAAIGLTGAGVRSRLARLVARLREDLGDA